jgi:hypothetical protein
MIRADFRAKGMQQKDKARSGHVCLLMVTIAALDQSTASAGSNRTVCTHPKV